MMITEERRNLLTGILGTVAFHLLAVIVFFMLKLGNAKEKALEMIVIEFAEEEYKPIEQIIEENLPQETPITPLSDKALKNIAVNAANEIENEISTDEYINQLKEELGMEDIFQDLERVPDDELVVMQSEKKEKPVEKKEYSGPTRITYNLEGRTGKIHRPIYKCQKGGEITINIIVDQQGYVINSSVASSSTSDICIAETALNSANRSRFNTDLQADPRQKGTITYMFVSQ